MYLSKDLDCVHYYTLVRKLCYYLFYNLLLNSYFSGRVQMVDVKGTRSSGIAMRVLQGPIVDPFLFLIMLMAYQVLLRV